MTSGPLAGITVLDFTVALAGPYGTQILGDLGARVIKIEPPEGEWTRSLAPHFIGKDSVYFLSINRNKESLALDLKTPEGLALVRRLAQRADVVVENFRPGVLQRLGLDDAALAAENPGLIWCAISGYGQDGPYRDKPAYDMIVQALSGGMSLTGAPGGPAVRAGIPIGDLAAGMYATIGILAALAERQRSGRGQKIDVAMLDCQIAMLCYQAAYRLHSGVDPGRQGRGHDSIPTYRGFDAAGGSALVVTANTEKMWQALARALELEALIDDPRFRTNDDRHRNRAALLPLLEAAFCRREAGEWVRLLEESGVPAAVVNTVGEALVDRQVRERGMVLDLAATDGRRVQVAGNPIRLSRTARKAETYPPDLGASLGDVLREILGMSENEIAAWTSKGKRP